MSASEQPPDLHVVHTGDVPPAALEAEKALLGCALRDPNLIHNTTDILDPADFYHTSHELLWEMLTQAADDGIDDSAVLIDHINTKLAGSDHLRRMFGPTTLPNLYTAPGEPLHAHTYACAIRDASRLRLADAALVRARQELRKDDADTQEVLEHVVDLIGDQALRFEPRTTTAAATGLHDLSWLTTGQAPEVPPPVWGTRLDGHALFYAGRVNGVFGDPESAKTWLAKMTCVEALQAGQLAAIVDVDHNGPHLTAQHMLLLGAHPDQLADPDLFRYYEPDDAAELRATVVDLTQRQPAVAVLDSIGELLPILGVKSVDNDEITMALRSLASPLARVGACVITIDHLPKAQEARATGYAIGGTAKRRALDGSYIFAETRVQPAPGQRGIITLRIAKDRPGELRKVCAGGKLVGDFILDSTRENITTAEIKAASSAVTVDGIFRPTGVMEKVSRFVENNPGVNFRSIKADVGGKGTTLRAAVDRLVLEGFMAAIPQGRETIHRPLRNFREDEDEYEQEAPPDDLF